jgi:hypothetical protein
MDEMIADAETKAQRIIDDAVAKRLQLNQTISSLLARRDEIAADAAKLAEELLDAVDSHRTSDSRDESVPSEPEESTSVTPDSEETSILEADSDEYGTKDELDGPSTLLVDPDEETPPHGLPR